MDNAIVIFINLLLGLMAAHLIKKGFEIFTDWPIESFEAESEGPFPFSFLPPVKNRVKPITGGLRSCYGLSFHFLMVFIIYGGFY